MRTNSTHGATRLPRERIHKTEPIMMQLWYESCRKQPANCTSKIINKKAQIICGFTLDEDKLGDSIALTKEGHSKLSVTETFCHSPWGIKLVNLPTEFYKPMFLWRNLQVWKLWQDLWALWTLSRAEESGL